MWVIACWTKQKVQKFCCSCSIKSVISVYCLWGTRKLFVQMAVSHCTMTHYGNKVDNIIWEQNVWLSFILNRIQSGRKDHVTLHFLCKNACHSLNNDLDGSEMTDEMMIKQVHNSSVIPANKGRSMEWADLSGPCVLYLFHVFTLLRVCVYEGCS